MLVAAVDVDNNEDPVPKAKVLLGVDVPNPPKLGIKIRN